MLRRLFNHLKSKSQDILRGQRPQKTIELPLKSQDYLMEFYQLAFFSEGFVPAISDAQRKYNLLTIDLEKCFPVIEAGQDTIFCDTYDDRDDEHLPLFNFAEILYRNKSLHSYVKDLKHISVTGHYVSLSNFTFMHLRNYYLFQGINEPGMDSHNPIDYTIPKNSDYTLDIMHEDIRILWNKERNVRTICINTLEDLLQKINLNQNLNLSKKHLDLN